jgi:hypothetical protein
MTQRYQISPQLRRPVVEVTPSPLPTQKFVGPEDDARQGYYDNRMHTPEELARGKKRIEDNLPPFNHVPFGQFRRTGEVLPAKQGAVGPPLPPLGVLTVPVGPTARPTRIPDKETKAMLEGLVTAEEYQKRKGYPVGATPEQLARPPAPRPATPTAKPTPIPPEPTRVGRVKEKAKDILGGIAGTLMSDQVVSDTQRELALVREVELVVHRAVDLGIISHPRVALHGEIRRILGDDTTLTRAFVKNMQDKYKAGELDPQNPVEVAKVVAKVANEVVDENVPWVVRTIAREIPLVLAPTAKVAKGALLAQKAKLIRPQTPYNIYTGARQVAPGLIKRGLKRGLAETAGAGAAALAPLAAGEEVAAFAAGKVLGPPGRLLASKLRGTGPTPPTKITTAPTFRFFTRGVPTPVKQKPFRMKWVDPDNALVAGKQLERADGLIKTYTDELKAISAKPRLTKRDVDKQRLLPKEIRRGKAYRDSLQRYLSERAAYDAANPIPVTQITSSVGELQHLPAVGRLIAAIKEASGLLGAKAIDISKQRGKRVGAAAAARRGGGTPEEVIAAMSKEMAGTYGTFAYTTKNPITIEDVTSLKRGILESNSLSTLDVLPAKDGLNKLLAGQLPEHNELVLLETVFGSDLARAIVNKRVGLTPWQTTLAIGQEAINIPRQLLAGFLDHSAVLNQGAFLSTRMPLKSLTRLKDTLKVWGSEEEFELFDNAIRQGRNFHRIQSIGNVFIADVRKGRVFQTEGEELFMSKVLQRVAPFRMSERAFASYLNKLRIDFMENAIGQQTKHYRKVHSKPGVPQAEINRLVDESVDAMLPELGRYVNWATGRGTLPSGPAKILSIGLFAPRLLASTFQLPFAPVAAFINADSGRKVAAATLVSKELAKDTVVGLGLGIGILTALDLSGAAEVEIDPRSTDFGRIRVGNLRINMFGRFQPIARLVAQMKTGQKKSTATGLVRDQPRLETLVRGGRTKLSPVGSLITDLWSGTTVIGEEMRELPIQSQLYNRLTPIFAQDLIDAVREDSPNKIPIAATGFFGLGVTTYKTEQTFAEEITPGVTFQNQWPYEKARAKVLLQEDRGGPRGEYQIRKAKYEEERLDAYAAVVANRYLSSAQKVAKIYQIEGAYHRALEVIVEGLFGEPGEDLPDPSDATDAQKRALKAYYDLGERVGSLEADPDLKFQEELVRLASRWTIAQRIYVFANTNTRPLPPAMQKLLTSVVVTGRSASAKERFQRMKYSNMARALNDKHRETGISLEELARSGW